MADPHIKSFYENFKKLHHMNGHEGCNCFSAVTYGSVSKVWARLPTCEIHQKFLCLIKCEGLSSL